MNALPISDGYKGNIMKYKETYDNPDLLSAFVKDQIPEEYKEMYEKGEQGIQYAVDLKAKKDQMQIDFISKTIAPLISIYDIN